MGITRTNNGTFFSISSRENCPVCNSKEGRCGYFVSNETNEIAFYRCKEKVSDKESNGWYIHTAKEVHGGSSTNYIPKKVNIEEYIQSEISYEDIIHWDKVYRDFRKAFKKLTGSYLYEEHEKYLLARGFSIEDINNMFLFSIPNNEKISYDNYTCSLSTAIVKELLKKYSEEDLLKVPGFSVRKGKHNDYIAFLNAVKDVTGNFIDADAILIPYFNKEGLIQGMQYRLTKPLPDKKGKIQRYRWYSSKNCTCGSPIDYYVPTDIKIDTHILITEGVLKARYSSKCYGIRTLAEAGVGNYRSLIKTLQEIEDKEQKKYDIILALDMDKYDNKDVLKAEIRTLTLLKSLGYKVTVLEWSESDGKGIDDKLFNTGFENIRYIQL